MPATAVAITDRPVWQAVVKGRTVNSAGIPPTNFAALFYYMSATPDSNRNAADFATAFATKVGATWNVVLPTNYVTSFFEVRDITSAINPVTFQTTFLVPGAAGANVDATNNAVYIQKVTQLRGRNYRGSWHLGPIYEPDVVEQLLTTAAWGKYAALGAKFIENITTAIGSIVEPMLLSSSLSTLDANPALLCLNKITAKFTRHNVGGMRRRQQGSQYF